MVKVIVKNVTAAGTAEKLTSDLITTKAVVIQAKDSNTDKVYIGASDLDSATANGISLSAGDTFNLADLEVGGTDRSFSISDFYVDSLVSGEGVVIFLVQGV